MLCISIVDNQVFRKLTLARIVICFLLSAFGAFTGASLASSPNQECSLGFFEEAYVPSGDVRIVAPPSRDLETPPKNTSISVSDFCISVNEVSVGDYAECVGDGACTSTRGKQYVSELPIHSVTFEEAQAFVKWLNEKKNLGYRLPSEAEWQRAALGGRDDRFPWRQIGRLPNVNIFSRKLLEVGVTSINEYGIRDMIGNLSEMVADCYTPDLDLIPLNGVPLLRNECQYRLTKGGHYSAPDFSLSPYFRAQIPSDFASPQIGFRVIRFLSKD